MTRVLKRLVEIGTNIIENFDVRNQRRLAERSWRRIKAGPRREAIPESTPEDARRPRYGGYEGV